MLASAVVLVSAVAASLGLMLTAKGKMVPDREAIAAAEVLETEANEVKACEQAARDVVQEVALFRGDIKVLEEPPPPEPPPAPEPPPPPGKPGPKKPPPGKEPPKPPEKKPKPLPENTNIWPAAQGTFEAAGRLAPCQAKVEKALASNADASAAWTAVGTVVKVTPSQTTDAPATQRAAAKQVWNAVDKAPLKSISEQVEAAGTKLAEIAKSEKTRAEALRVQQPLKRGVLGREIAIAAGVLVSLIALLVSFFSLRATSVRRAATLAPLRRAIRPPERGLHAATILRLASESNGGEPGIVLGAALGGLIAAAIGRADADWYVAGVAAGLVLGLLVQIVVKGTGGTRGFRERALGISDIEKPAVPMVLVLSTIRQGEEENFLSFFLKLSPAEAANAVEKLATQAEEQILIAADAHALPPQ